MTITTRLNLKALNPGFSARKGPGLFAGFMALAALLVGCSHQQPQTQVLSSPVNTDPCLLGATYLTTMPNPQFTQLRDSIVARAWFGRDSIYSEVSRNDDDSRGTYLLRKDSVGNFSSLNVRIQPESGRELARLTGFDVSISEGVARTQILSVNNDAPTLEAQVAAEVVPYFHRSPFFFDLILRQARAHPGRVVPLLWVGVSPYYLEDARVEQLGSDSVRVVTDYFDLNMAVDSNGLLRGVDLPLSKGVIHITRTACG